MSKADLLYNELIREIHEKGSWDKDGVVRTVYEDGSPAYTKSLFGKQVVFEEGEIPLLTSKKVFWKTAYKEMLLFWVKQTVKKEDFEKENVKVWQEWFLEDNTLGKSYAYQFESRPKKEIVEVKPIIKQINKNKDIQLLGKYDRKMYGVANMGDYKKINSINEYQLEKLINVWKNMLKRCYYKDSVDYDNYGGIGVFVDEEWLLFENFLRDIQMIPQWHLAKDNLDKWDLDKDYYSSNCYSLETCVWLSKSDNCHYRKDVRPIYIVDKEGNKELFLSIKHGAEKYNLDRGDCSKVLNGKRSHVKGFSVIEANDNIYPLRYKISQNQVVDLLNNIKNNPMSRRLMTSFWNYADVSEKALQECAMQTTWNIRDGKLDLLLYSRSVDAPLGLPFNWIQYWFLLQMVSQVTGYKAGRFIHQMGNVHYYDRHEEELLNQLESPIFEQPEFWINTEVKSFFSFTPDDIKIFNYENNGNFKYEIAI